MIGNPTFLDMNRFSLEGLGKYFCNKFIERKRLFFRLLTSSNATNFAMVYETVRKELHSCAQNNVQCV